METPQKSSEHTPSSSLRSIKSQKLNFSHEAVVSVGQDKKHYTIPQCFLTRHSSFFAAATDTEWHENGRKPIELPDHSPSTFEIYLQLLYTNELVILSPEQENAKMDLAERAETSYPILLDLYILTNSVRDVRASNMIVDMWLEVDVQTRYNPTSEVISRAWEMLPCTAKLITVCRWQSTRLRQDRLKEIVEDNRWPARFVSLMLLDYAELVSRGEKPKTAEKLGYGFFHEVVHEEEEG